MDKTNKPLRTGVVFGDAPAPLGAMWAELSELEDRLGERLRVMDAGARVVAGGLGWTLRERGEQLELVCGRMDGRRLVDAHSRFEFSLDWVDVEEEQLQAQIDALRDILGRMGH